MRPIPDPRATRAGATTGAALLRETTGAGATATGAGATAAARPALLGASACAPWEARSAAATTARPNLRKVLVSMRQVITAPFATWAWFSFAITRRDGTFYTSL